MTSSRHIASEHDRCPKQRTRFRLGFSHGSSTQSEIYHSNVASEKQLMEPAPVGRNSFGLRPAKAFLSSASKYRDTETRTPLVPRTFHRGDGNFIPPLFQPFPASLQTTFPAATMSLTPCPGKMFPIFPCRPKIFVFATSTSRLCWIILHESRQLPVAATTGSAAVFRLLSRANGQPT